MRTFSARSRSKTTVLRQAGNPSAEIRTVLHAALLEDLPVVSSPISSLALHAEALRDGRMFPVGSVAFLREAMRVSGIPEPPSISYPPALASYLRRTVTRGTLASLTGTVFVKPLRVKLFTGFVCDGRDGPAEDLLHDHQQFAVLVTLPAETEVWIAEPVKWVSEVRYYVLDGVIVGHGRYDGGPDDAVLPDEWVVTAMVHAFADAPASYALDVGVLDNGETALVEANDGWALGYYRGSLQVRDYARLLESRWRQLVRTADGERRWPR
jgi:hypothetical protein